MKQKLSFAISGLIVLALGSASGVAFADNKHNHNHNDNHNKKTVIIKPTPQKTPKVVVVKAPNNKKVVVVKPTPKPKVIVIKK